MNEIKNLAAV